MTRQSKELRRGALPPLIAGYLVHCQSYAMPLASALTRPEDSCEDHVAPDVQAWLARKENQEAFARAWLDGYEVEREKLYTVEIPNTGDPFWRYAVLRKGTDGVYIDKTDSHVWQNYTAYQLTESEIRKDFEWAWQAGFAQLVEEDK